ncbi:MAG: hypothetical protein AAFU64_00160 [Bacteroidota bacterium]
MKNALLGISLFLLVGLLSNVSAQAPKAPKDGFQIFSIPGEIVLPANSELDFQLGINRSKRFSKTKIQLQALGLADGISLELSPRDLNHVDARLKLDKQLAPGEYTLTILARSPFKNKTYLLDIRVEPKGSPVKTSNK